MKQIAGIDVGKQFLDVSIQDQSVKRYTNDEQGRRSLTAKLQHDTIERVVCEATGGYERELVTALHEQGIPVHVAHPNKVRAYAQALGCLAKTDRLDAEVLREYGEHFPLPIRIAQDEVSVQLRQLVRRRQQLVRMRSEEKNRLEHSQESIQRESVKRHIDWLDAEVREIENAYRRHIDEAAGLAKRLQLYQSVRGIGELTALTLLSELPELGQVSGASITSLVGLAPWSHDSGKHRGYRAIRGGRAHIRKALYMSALSVVRYDSGLKTFYLRLRRRGKPGKVALVAVMRKLLLTLNAVAKRGTPWVENQEKLLKAA